MTIPEIPVLPSGWATASISDLIGFDGIFSDGDWVESKDQDPDGDVRLIQLADIGDGKYLNKSARFLTSGKADELRCTFLRTGDVLIARMPDPLGRATIFPGDGKSSVTVVDVCIIRSGELSFEHRWLVSSVNSPACRATIDALQSGTTRKRISRKNLATIQLPVPPLAEQHRIVAEIEKQFTRLDAAVASLKRARSTLKRYRASVLKAACEGKLVPTEAELARAENRDYEPADALLQRILKERRARWEADELTKMRAKGREPKDDEWKAKYKEPVTADTSDLPELPEGWEHCLSDALLTFVTSGSRGWARYYSDSGSIFIRVGNLSHETTSLSLDEVQYVRPPLNSEGTRTKVTPGDILISITADLGRVALVPDGLGEAFINQHVALARPTNPASTPFLAWFLISPSGGGDQFQRFDRGVTRLGLGLDDIRSAIVPLPPLAEQRRIVAEVERRLSVNQASERVVEVNLRRAERLRQSILKKAFEGKLVPQDPTDEPASVLLERIRAERAAAEPTKKLRKAPRRRTKQEIRQLPLA